MVSLLVWATALPLVGSDRILLNRIGPSGADLFIAKADGTTERKVLPSSEFDYNPSFSKDGNWIIFTSERNGSADIYRVRVDGSDLERLTDDPAYDDQAALSPNGNLLAFVSSRGSGSSDIWILDLKTRQLRNVTNAPGDFRPSWSPDGKWIAFSSDRGTKLERVEGGWEHLHAASIYLVQPDGNGLRRLTPAGKFAGSPKWSPDGKRVIFYEMPVADTLGDAHDITSEIVSIDIATGKRTEHTSGPGLKISPQYLSAGRIGYLLKKGQHDGLAFTTGESGAAGEMRSPAWSADAKWVVYHKASNAWVQNRGLFSINPKFELAYTQHFPAFSRDGKLLVVAGGDVAESNLTVMNPDGSGSRTIFFEKGSTAYFPVWAPAGDWIAAGVGAYFGDNRTKPARILMLRPDGAEPRDLTKGMPNAGFPSWSPDGTRIVYRVWRKEEHGLRILNLKDGSITMLTTGYDNFPAWSPRGDLISFTSFRNGDFDIYTIKPGGTGLRQLTTAPGNDAHAVWSPDGRYLLFSSGRFGYKDEGPLYDDVPQPYAELFVMNADGSHQRPLTDNAWEDGTPAWQPAIPSSSRQN
jgi:Tol biopolymer transport system component